MLQYSDFLGMVGEPLIRSDIYNSLCAGFKYPTREKFEKYQNGHYLRELEIQLSSLIYFDSYFGNKANLVEEVSRELKNVDYLFFELKYVKTFAVGDPLPACPAYEGIYSENGSRIDILNEISGIYKRYGLPMNQDGLKHELPDYLCSELDFMRYLTSKQAQAWENNDREHLETYFVGQKAFLEQHLLKWLPKFHAKAQAEGALPFYPHLARITLEYVTAEYEVVSAIQAEL